MAMVEKVSKSRVVFNIFNYLVMALLAFIFLIPIWHIVMSSFSEPYALYAHSGLVWYPLGGGSIKGFSEVFSYDWLWSGFGNTLLYVAFTAIVGTFLTTIAGYLLSRKRFKLRKFLTMFILFTMIFSGGIIPSYMVIVNLNLIDTRWAIFLTGLMNAFYIIIMKNAFEQIPDSIEEAARIDGASDMRVLFQILFPMVLPTIAVVMLFAVVQQWNSWYYSSIYQPFSRDLWPIQMFIRELSIQGNAGSLGSGIDKAEIQIMRNLVSYCVIVVATLPILVAYPFAQKFFISGITAGSVKE